MMKKLLIIAGLLTGTGLSAAEPAIAAAANAAKIATETVLKNPITIQAAVQKVVTVCKQTLAVCSAAALGAVGTLLSVAPKDIAEGAADAAANGTKEATKEIIDKATEYAALSATKKVELLEPALQKAQEKILAMAALAAAKDKRNLIYICAAAGLAYIGITTALEQYITNKRIKDRISSLPANQLNQAAIKEITDNSRFYFNIPFNPVRWFF